VLQDTTGAHFCIWQEKRPKAEAIGGAEGTLCWADLMTRDTARAEKFYSGLLSWTFGRDEKDPSDYTHIKNGREFIGGMPPSRHLDAMCRRIGSHIFSLQIAMRLLRRPSSLAARPASKPQTWRTWDASQY